jgi:hypothetical protein
MDLLFWVSLRPTRLGKRVPRHFYAAIAILMQDLVHTDILARDLLFRSFSSSLV